MTINYPFLKSGVSRLLLLIPVVATVCFTSGSNASTLVSAPKAIMSLNANHAVPQTLLTMVNNEDMGVGAENFVGSMATRAIEFLGNHDLKSADKKSRFRKLLNESFDMNTISRFALGRYWRASTPEQRKEYQKLFQAMVIEVYSQRFSEYSDQEFETKGYRVDSQTDTIVTSVIRSPSGPDIQVDWRVRYKNNRYKVVDIIVEGVSMSLTQRSDFSSVIQRGGGNVSVLLAHLRSE
jgi:phospholipid transport system substrate-binding protein